MFLSRINPRRPAVPGITLASGARDTAPTGACIELAGVTKRFGRRQVLRALDLSVAAGSFISIIGRSGCGKSTLLRLIAGLDRPQSGAVLLDDAAFTGLAPSTTVMFQDSRLLPWQRVLDNVRLAGLSGDAASSLRALRQVGLADRARDWPAGLSGGQKQRVALARALVSEPRVLLLDEPLGALDALTRRDMQRLLESIWQERRFTAVLVTHDVMEAVTLSDRVLVLRDGAIAMDLPIDLPRPRHQAAGAVAELEDVILSSLGAG
jgi:sulfonate transport system ATP-binding protein